jgi:hypothetical protein
VSDHLERVPKLSILDLAPSSKAARQAKPFATPPALMIDDH